MDRRRAGLQMHDCCGNCRWAISHNNVSESQFVEAVREVVEVLELIVEDGIDGGISDKIIHDAYINILQASADRLKLLKYPQHIKEAASIMQSLYIIAIDEN